MCLIQNHNFQTHIQILPLLIDIESLLSGKSNQILCYNLWINGEYVWCSDESACLPPIWLGFWLGWVCCWFLPCSNGFHGGLSVSSLYKNQHLQIPNTPTTLMRGTRLMWHIIIDLSKCCSLLFCLLQKLGVWVYFGIMVVVFHFCIALLLQLCATVW